MYARAKGSKKGIKIEKKNKHISTNIPVMMLSEEQETALQKFHQGHNLFLTGPAGTGKSFLIDRMVQSADQRGLTIQVTAMTGVAAVLLGKRARTLHSWSGIQLAKDEPHQTAQRVSKQPRYKNNWKQTRILVVDEVSMMSKHVFDTLQQVAAVILSTTKDRPFGPLQVIFVGDLFQLPPVGQTQDEQLPCFESAQWSSTFAPDNHIELKTVFRQSDPVYAAVLNQVREGQLDEEGIQRLQGRVQVPPPERPLTRFFPKRAAVDHINREAFSALAPDPTHTYPVGICTTMRFFVDTGTAFRFPAKRSTQPEKDREVQTLLAHAQLTEPLSLRLGTLVMCTCNWDLTVGIVNGSQGKVVEFTPTHMVKVFDQYVPIQLPVVQFHNGYKTALPPKVWQSSTDPTIAVSQIPLVPCWAMTIHKAQGATLDAAEMDVGNDIFECGQAYVALSRVKTLDGLFLRSFNAQKIRANPMVKAFYAKIRQEKNNQSSK